MFYCFPLLLLYCTRYTYVIVNYTIYIYTYLYSTSAHGIYLFILWNWCHVNVCVGWLDNIEQKIINCVALFRSVFTLRPLIKPPPRLIPIAALQRTDRSEATEAIRQFLSLGACCLTGGQARADSALSEKFWRICGI